MTTTAIERQRQREKAAALVPVVDHIRAVLMTCHRVQVAITKGPGQEVNVVVSGNRYSARSFRLKDGKYEKC